MRSENHHHHIQTQHKISLATMKPKQLPTSMTTNNNNTCCHGSHDQESNKVVGNCNGKNQLKNMDSSRKRSPQSNDTEALLVHLRGVAIEPMTSESRSQAASADVTIPEGHWPDDDTGGTEDTGRERLKRHRGEVAGRVWIPEMWGQEELLKDLVDSCAFDASWMNANIILARTALVEGSRTHHSTTLSIDNTC